MDVEYVALQRWWACVLAHVRVRHERGG
jgi:hypothetical protein